MLRYLKSLQRIRGSTSFPEYTIVAGNQAADMDSCCSAIITAYLETELNNKKTVPLMSIPRDDLRLRRDIEFVFKNLNIDPEWLLFIDDVTLNNTNSLFLVDHNAPTIPGVVRSVLDHHDIEDHKLDLSKADPVVIKKSGSCVSVVINHYFKKFGKAMSEVFAKEPTLAPLAISPLLQDTNGFTKKVEDEDREAMSFLKNHMGDASNIVGFSPFDSFATMKKEKSNLEGLSMRDLLRKDYKQWGGIGISSLPKLIEKLVKKGLQDLPDALERFRKTENLDIMVALANGVNKRTDQYERQLVYCGPMDFDIASQCPSLELALTAEMEGVRFYNQKNTAASRKQVAPELKAAFEQYLGKDHQAK